MKYLFILLLLCLGMGAWAGNVVTISSAEGAPSDEVTISIGLQNTDAVSSLQVSIPLNEDMTLVESSEQLGNRCASHSLTVGVKEGVLNVLLYSTNMAAISGTGGEVASFKLKLGNQPGTISLTPSKMVLTNTIGSIVAGTAEAGSVTIRCAKAQYSVMDVDFGAVPIRSTYSKTVTVTNAGNDDLIISALNFSDVNVFSSTTSLPLTIGAGVSRELNVTYAPVERGEIHKTLKVECNSSSKLNTIQLKAQPYAVNELHVQDVSGTSDEEVTIKMTMNNMDAINGLQLEFTMPDQLEYVDGSFELSNRKEDHQIVSTLNGKDLKIIAYSPSGKTFTGEDGEIGSFKVKLVGKYNATLIPTKAVLTATINNKVENVVSKVYGAKITIKYPSISTDDLLDFGAVSVTEACEKTFTIRNYGNVPLTISRITFSDENFTVKETLPLTIQSYGSSNITVVYGSIDQKSFEATMNIYCNDPDQRLRVVKVTGSRFAPNYLTASTHDIYTDEDCTIGIMLNTYDAVQGLQFDIVYPSQYYSLSGDAYTLESRAEGMSVTMREIDDKTQRVFCYFMGGNGIAAGEGQIMRLLLKRINSKTPEGTYSVSLKNIKLGTEELTDKNAGKDIQCSFKVTEEQPVTITVKNCSRKYGETNPTFEYMSEGGSLVGIPEITCEASATSPVGSYDIIIKQGSVTNRTVTYVNGTLTITKAPLAVKVGTYTKKQGDDNPEFTLTYEGWKNDETETVLTKKPTATTTATKESAPGEYEVTVSGGEAQNYELSYTNGKLIVTDADPVTITAKSYTREYGEANPTFEYEVSGAKLNGTPEISCEATATSPAGTYDIIVKHGGVKNYNVTYVKGILTIIKAPLSVKAGTYTKKQGEDNPEFTLTYEGWKNNETEAVLTKKPTATTTATKESEPGEYEVTVSGGEAQNYELSYSNGKLIVTDADPVTITAKSYTRVYGEANPRFEYTSEGAILVGTPEITCEATATSPVGTYPIVIKKGSVTNYNDTYVNGTLTIIKAPLSVKASTYTKKQGEDNPEFTLTYEGWKNNETEVVLTKKPTATTTATKESEPGEYEVTVSGGEARNYELSYTNGKLIVTDADAVIVKAKSYTRTYGDDNPSFEYEVSGTTLDGKPEISCEAISSSPVGTYDIIVKQGSVKNYNVTYINGTLTITKAPLSVKAGTYTKKQGEDNPEFIISYSGWKLNEDESVLTKKPKATTTATKDSPVGEYEIMVSGGEARNYELKYQNGVLTVTESTGIATISVTNPVNVYNVQGRLVRSKATTLEGLPSGVYIVNGQKVVVK